MADTPTVDDNSKAPWLSKTIVTNAIIGMAALYPPVAVAIAAHSVLFSVGMSLLNIVLRSISEKKIDLSLPGAS